ncbi:hypothetical protein [Anaerovorax odorimutans]|uniref:hypothetical protein n=1 Tax=Anaerovorax odorimutans TaxID=109327 RepID=UPI0004064535|nr:hypothetical protein [Anaerovorax odorimutans]
MYFIVVGVIFFFPYIFAESIISIFLFYMEVFYYKKKSLDYKSDRIIFNSLIAFLYRTAVYIVMGFGIEFINLTVYKGKPVYENLFSILNKVDWFLPFFRNSFESYISILGFLISSYIIVKNSIKGKHFSIKDIVLLVISSILVDINFIFGAIHIFWAS